MTTIDKIVFSQNAPAKNTLWARPSEKGTELLIFNKGKWGTVGADDFQRFHYEMYSSLEDITEPKPNALYLIGPKPEGEDKYDEYVYTEEGFTKIGDTGIDMSDVIKYSKNSDDSYTLKAEGTEIKKLKTTDDSTVILGDNNSIEFGASGTINMQSGNISGVKDIQMTYGKIDNLWDIYGGYNDTHIYMTGNNNINVGGATIDNVGTISGSSGGLDIRTTTGEIVNINGAEIYWDGSMSVPTLSFQYKGTVPTYINGLQDIFGVNGAHISMSGSPNGNGIDFGNALMKGVKHIVMTTGGTINNANTINIVSGTLNVIGGVIDASGALLKMSNTSITGKINATNTTINNVSLSNAHINGGLFTGNIDMGSVNISGNINGASGAVNIGFSGTGISGKLDMISGILETSGVTLKSGGILTFGDGTTMNTASQFSGTLRGTIENTTFSSGNNFTSEFIDELKTALGIS